METKISEIDRFKSALRPRTSDVVYDTLVAFYQNKIRTTNARPKNPQLTQDLWEKRVRTAMTYYSTEASLESLEGNKANKVYETVTTLHGYLLKKGDTSQELKKEDLKRKSI